MNTDLEKCKGSYRGGAWFCVCGADSPKDCPLKNPPPPRSETPAQKVETSD